MVHILAYSQSIAKKVLGPPQRGLVHSAFASAANLVFPTNFFLSLNAAPALFLNNPDRWPITVFAPDAISLPLLPNGILFSAQAETYPFNAFKAGQAVILGAGCLWFEDLNCSFGLTTCPRWSPQIEPDPHPNLELLASRVRWLQQLCAQSATADSLDLDITPDTHILALAEKIGGRGPGLTPGGDDFLLGWMAAGWLLSASQPAFPALCQQIVTLTRKRTHALSHCWLTYAALGQVSQPVGALLAALLTPEQKRLERTAYNLLAIGATSGRDTLCGIVHALSEHVI